MQILFSKAAGLSKKFARTIGIAVDHRRRYEMLSFSPFSSFANVDYLICLVGKFPICKLQEQECGVSAAEHTEAEGVQV